MTEQIAEPAQAVERTWNEAPASLNIRFTLAGFESQLTLRADSGAELLRKLTVVLQALREMGAEPAGHHSQQASTNPQGAVNGNGNGYHESADKQPPVCAIHGTTMTKRQNSRTGASFWSCGTKLADGSWCPYRPKQA